MATISLPFDIQNGTIGDADQVMGNFNAITSVVNGGLTMGSNVQATAPTSPVTGKSDLEGTSVFGLRADAQFILQGFENLTDDPTTSNFDGRIYWNTTTPALRVCTDSAGSGTFEDLSQAAATLVIHAAQHKAGGHDPLADNTITPGMRDDQTVATATQSGAINLTTTYATLCDLSVTTTGVQTLAVSLKVRLANSSGGARSSSLRVVDHTASDVTIWRIPPYALESSGNADTEIAMPTFFYTTPDTGARTLRLQGRGAGSGYSTGDVKSTDPTVSEGSDSTTGNATATMMAVIL